MTLANCAFAYTYSTSLMCNGAADEMISRGNAKPEQVAQMVKIANRGVYPTVVKFGKSTYYNELVDMAERVQKMDEKSFYELAEYCLASMVDITETKDLKPEIKYTASTETNANKQEDMSSRYFVGQQGPLHRTIQENF